MAAPQKYFFPPTALIPNSPYPLLYYPGFLLKEVQVSPNFAATTCYHLFNRNGWTAQWIFRYGPSQPSHYHSSVHECMAVLTGSARIRFGVADTTTDLEKNTHGTGSEEGGIEIVAKAGDVFVIPAGVAHKTFETKPEADFQLLTPGQGRGIEAEDKHGVIAELDLSGFTMIGAYPVGNREWNFARGGEDAGNFEAVWTTSMPVKDPILGEAESGLLGVWN